MVVHKPREKVAALIVFFLPLALVEGGALMLGGGAAEAQARPVGKVKPPDAPVLMDPPTWTDEQRMVAEHIALLRTQPFGPSPLFHVTAAPPPDRPDNDTRLVRPQVPPPDVVVQLILTRSDGNHVALIDRKRYQVGDAIGEHGWIVTRIDGSTRSVTIEHPPSERTATLLVPLPR
ncbi:MAG: hypothetical protein ACYS15_08140 [Planctomycetota bacterium]|jgi:hypothetical protein